MTEDTIRSVTIRGDAKDHYLKAGTRRRKGHRGGYDGPPPPAPSSAGDLAPSPMAELPGIAPLPPQSSTPVSSGGANTRKKLVLLEKKNKAPSVLLTQKESRFKKKLSGQIGQTRKVRIHMNGLRSRMTRAKAIHRSSEKEPIKKIMETLEEAGLVKKGGEPSKEREVVLRGIYRDYLQLRTNAL
jgi:hypothetical protein